MPFVGTTALTELWAKVKAYVDSQTGGDGGDGPSIGTATATPTSASGSIQFANLLGEPTSFVVVSKANLSTGAAPFKVADVMFDGTDIRGNIITNTSNAQQTADSTGFSKSYSNGTLTVSCTSANFQANQYDLVYTYGQSGNIGTKSVQVGSGATSIGFSGLEDEPTFWAVVFTSNFATSSGYQRVIAVANDGTDTFGLAMGSGAVASSSYWTGSYSNGTLTVQSSGTNAGGYFHQPGNYLLLYSYGGGESGGGEFEESDPVFTASAAHGISSSDISNWNAKQAALVSGTNIKTINNQSLLGSGNISISGEGGITTETDPVFSASAAAGIDSSDISAWDAKQDALVSGTNIKTINNQSLLGSGNISISGGGETARMTWYGTCNTTASTAAKSVTCSGFSLEAGAIIAVLFSTGNTASTPTLNVNSTGALSIYVGSSTPSGTDNVLKWSANTLVAFMYDGTYWRYLFSESAGSIAPSRGAASWYGTCSTTSSTAAKTSSIDNFVLTKGARVTILASTANTNTGALTLNVNSTGAKTIYKGSSATSSSNQLTWSAGDVLTFVYDGSYWRYVGTSNPPTGSGGGITTETDPVFSASAAAGIDSSDISAWDAKQDALVSGTNIKTINNQSLLGSGNISISGGGGGISLSDVYPVGSIYMSVSSTSPATLFGGTWVQLKDMFLLGAGDTYALDNAADANPVKDGGEAEHTLTGAESGTSAHSHGFTQPTISNHNHQISEGSTYNLTSSSAQNFTTGNYKIGSSGTTYNGFVRNTGSNVISRDSNYTQYSQPTASGGAVNQATAANASSPHNNMPPYLVVYMWKRTA